MIIFLKYPTIESNSYLPSDFDLIIGELLDIGINQFSYSTIELLDLPRVLRGGSELVLDNFHLNLLQLVISHIPSVKQLRRSCTVHNNLHGNPNWEKTT